MDRAIEGAQCSFIGKYVFEELCREWVSVAGASGKLGFLPEAVGGFWTQANTSGLHRGVELDVVAAQHRAAVLSFSSKAAGRPNGPDRVCVPAVERLQQQD